MNTCHSCGHAALHTPLVGCLELDCDCTETLTQPKTIETARAERDAAMEKAERGTDPGWESQAERAIRDLAILVQAEDKRFTPDDVWDLLERRKVPAPREPRALGPILKRLARAKVLEHQGYDKSRRRHAAPVSIYKAGPEL